MIMHCKTFRRKSKCVVDCLCFCVYGKFKLSVFQIRNVFWPFLKIFYWSIVDLQFLLVSDVQ